MPVPTTSGSAPTAPPSARRGARPRGHPGAAGEVVSPQQFPVVVARVGASELDPEFVPTGKGRPCRPCPYSIAASAVFILLVAWALDRRGNVALIVFGPLVGAVAATARGGRGISGGIVGGVASYGVFGNVM